jgi:hypothetical protein
MAMRILLRSCLVVVLIVAGVSGILFYETFVGLWRLKVSGWPSDKYVGQNFVRLEADLASARIEVLRCAGDSLFAHTGRKIKDGERGFVFENGRPYSWFRMGTASNMGYIVTKSDADNQIVVEVLRGVVIDSL